MIIFKQVTNSETDNKLVIRCTYMNLRLDLNSLLKTKMALK